MHIFSDVITSYGTIVLAPCSDYKLALSTTFIILRVGGNARQYAKRMPVYHPEFHISPDTSYLVGYGHCWYSPVHAVSNSATRTVNAELSCVWFADLRLY